MTTAPANASPGPTRPAVEGGAARAGRSSLSVPLLVLAPGGPAAQPITVGLPLPRGTLWEPRSLRLEDAAGNAVPVQAEALARWPDGSVRWLLTDFLLGPVPAGRHSWALRAGDEVPLPPAPAVTVEEGGDAVVVDTGAAVFRVDCRTLRPLANVAGNGFELAVLSRVELAGLGRLRRGRDAGRPRVESVAVEQRGPVRATLCLRGRWAGRPVCRFVARLCFFAGTGLVRLRLTIYNPERAKHKGSVWDLGDPWSVYFDALSVCFTLPGVPEVRLQAEPGLGPEAGRGGLSLLQASSGGDIWQGRAHVDHEGRVTLPFRGYRVRGGGVERSGLRASPVLSLRGERAALTVAVPEFWQQFPKALRVDKGELAVDLFPARPGGRHELQGGEQKTHTVWLHVGPPSPADDLPLGWAHAPAVALAAPPWCAESGAIPFLPAGPVDGRFERLLTEALEGPDSFFAKREHIDEYGWRHFGELYADHENEHYPGPKPVVSHYNNQYDALNGMLLQWLRTGDRRWWELADPLARHVFDIDVYHTDRDRPAYSGGMFWHTDHYRDAATATHRSYSRANKPPGQTYGGGPGNEHNWGTGLLHYYYLTGEPLARDAVLGLADWAVRSDDGRLTLLGLVDDGPTGLASRTGADLFHGPGRGGGNSINALLDGWLLTGARPYVDKAAELVRRCAHPSDDLAAMDLTDPERRWSYTVFLSVLARYAELKLAAGEADEGYAYARAVLLHYGSWMSEHERPYFDRVDLLEFPNETWAAQEMRKANALRLCARHADGSLRERMRRRGEELAERAWHDVFRFETRTSSRSLAILLTEGPRDSCLRARLEDVSEAGPAVSFEGPGRFVPQRQRVCAELRTARGLLRAVLRALDPRRSRKGINAIAETAMPPRRPVVCQLLHGLRVGGAEVLAARLVRRLRDRYRFRFVCLDELGTLGEGLRAEGFPVDVAGRRAGVDWRLPLRLARLFLRGKISLIHAHQYTPFFYALAARLLHREPPVLFTEHGRWAPDYPRRKRIVANRLLLERRDRVVGVGESLRRALVVNEGIPGHRVGVIYNGIDLAPYATPAADCASLRRQLGLANEDFVVIQVARLVPIKDHATALRCFRQVAAQVPRARFLVVGEGPEDAAVRASAEECGLQHRVLMLGLRSDVPRLLAAADVFLLSSINEGIPLTVIEAMAAGLPVVATDVGGVAEVVRDGETGLLAPAGDDAALAGHVLRLAADPATRDHMGRAGRARAFALFSEEKMLAAYDGLYREMLHV